MAVLSLFASLQGIAETIADRKTHDFKSRYHAMEQLEQLAAQKNELQKHLKKLEIEIATGLGAQIGSHRANIVRQACFASVAVVQAAPSIKFGVKIMQALCDKTETNWVTRRHLSHAGQVICANIPSSTILKLLSLKIDEGKSKHQVLPCVGYLYSLITNQDPAWLKEQKKLIESCILAAMRSFNAQSRRAGVACANAYNTKLPARSEDFLKSLHPRLADMVATYRAQDKPVIVLNLAHQKKQHEARERRVERKLKALKKVRDRNVELPKFDVNIQNLQKYFRNIDKNGDCKISQYELGKALEVCGMETASAEGHALDFFTVADVDESGFVDTEEFVKEILRMQALCTVRALHRRFKIVDPSQGQAVSRQELEKYFSARIEDQRLIDELLNDIFTSVDTSTVSSPSITIDELEEWYVRHEDAIMESRMLERRTIKNIEEIHAKQGKERPQLSPSGIAILEAAKREIKEIEAGDHNKNITPRPPQSERKLGRKANLVVICGPSAVGKGTILGILRERYPGMFGVAVSHTTRGPREGEIDGKHYHFVDRESFLAMKANGEFLEFADVHGKFYGTSKAAVNKVCERGGICILEIDVQGAKTIKGTGVEAKFLFITTSGGIEELERRLRGRGTEKEDKIQKRLKTSRKELGFLKKNPEFFDKVLSNDILEKATEELRLTFTKWYPKLNERAASAL